MGVGFAAATVVVAAILLKPTVFPQFTLNAGLLAVCAVLGTWAYVREGGVGSLMASAVFAFVSFLIRWQELVLVLCIALPWVTWRRERMGANTVAVLIGFVVAIFSAAVIDAMNYQGVEWERFHELNAARAPFTDFGVGEQLKQRPEILRKFHYTTNDIDLISSFFFVDPRIADPRQLKVMLSEFGAVPFLRGNMASALQSVQSLFDPELLPFFVGSTLLFFLRPTRALAISWLILFGVLLLAGLAGRGGVLRIYLPMLYLLLAGGVVQIATRSSHLAGLRGAGLVGARFVVPAFVLVASLMLVAPAAKQSRLGIQQAQSDYKNLPSDLIFAWGAALPIELIFPPLVRQVHARTLRMYPFGVFTYAPFSVAVAEEAKGPGFQERLFSEKGLLMVASGPNIELLRHWCQQHHGLEMRESLAYSSPTITVRQVWCGK